MPIILEVIWLWIRIWGFYLEALYRKFVPLPPEDIRGKLVLITGASRGIGRELALEFARNGARLALWDIDKTGNEETAEQVSGLGVEARAYTCDITNTDQVAEAANQVRADLGDVDILVNNAGIMICKHFMDLTENEIRKTFEINIIAQFWIVKQFLPAMMERDYGRIVNLASMAGRHGSQMLTDYCASKFGVVGFSEALQVELLRMGCEGVKLTFVCPMGVNTNLLSNIADRVEYRDKLGSVLQPQEVAQMVVDGVRRKKAKIFCPDHLKNSVLMAELMPRKAQRLVGEFVDSGFFPSKGGKAE